MQYITSAALSVTVDNSSGFDDRLEITLPLMPPYWEFKQNKQSVM